MVDNFRVSPSENFDAHGARQARLVDPGRLPMTVCAREGEAHAPRRANGGDGVGKHGRLTGVGGRRVSGAGPEKLRPAARH